MTVIELQKLREMLANDQLPTDSFVINEQPGFIEIWCHPNSEVKPLSKRLMGAKHVATIYLGNESIEIHRAMSTLTRGSPKPFIGDAHEEPK